jgi:hypothetical protein
MTHFTRSILLQTVLLAASGCAVDASGDGKEIAGADASSQRDAATQNAPALAPPKHGVQLATRGREIPAGADQEWCEVVALPGDPAQTYLVGRTELAMTPFSHHIIVSMAPPDSHTLDEVELGSPEPCLGAHEYGTDLTTLAGSALPYNEATLPDGIGYTLRGGQRLLFDYHALNTSDQPIRAAHKLNLHFVDAIERPARTFGFYNQYIDIPAHTSRVFGDQCMVKNELLVWHLTRHTHRFGTRFRVWWVGGEHDGELLWTSDDWETDIDYRFDPPVTMAAGTGFRWECAYDNPTDGALTSGPRATDEMCILFGAFAAIGNDSDVGPQSCYRFAPQPVAQR